MSSENGSAKEFWIDRWRQGQTAFHLDRINPVLLKYFDSLEIAPGSSVLLPLCGKSHDLVWLRDKGMQVTGVEVSEIAINALAEEHSIAFEKTKFSAGTLWTTENLRIFEGDFFALAPEDLGPIDFVYDRAALIALPTPTRRAYADHLNLIAGTRRRGLMITLEYDQSEMAGPPYSVPHDEVDSLFGSHFEITPISVKDVLNDIPRFKEAGLTRLHEPVYVLEPRNDDASLR